MKLGKNQEGVLKCLSGRTFGFIDRPFGCGWVWASKRNTVKILESLLKKGLVVKGELRDQEEGSEAYPQYTISPAGLEFLRGIDAS